MFADGDQIQFLLGIPNTNSFHHNNGPRNQIFHDHLKQNPVQYDVRGTNGEGSKKGGYRSEVGGKFTEVFFCY